MKIIAADLFCGAGGESTGLYQACIESGHELDLLAVNHCDIAIETHSKNHPYARHLCESVQSIDPTSVVSGGRLNLLWASPECTHHSNAKGGKPRSNQSRASAWLILKWLSELYVDRVIIENVPEFLNWGPLGASGKPLKSRRGDTFRAFVTALQSLGYRVDWRLLCAADYGDPTTRKRFFLQAIRGRNRIAWPRPTHSRDPDMFCSNRWIPASRIIDWSISGKSIFNRKKPLAGNTLRRIGVGIRRYWGEFAEPFLIILRGTGTARSVELPLPTVTTSGAHYGLIEPFILASGHASNIRNRTINAPLSTVVTKAEHCLVEPLLIDMTHPAEVYDSRIYLSNAPLRTITTRNNTALLRPFLIKYYGRSLCQSTDRPLDTVTTNDRFALIDGNPYLLDIRFRMLLPHELAAAQGFPLDYWFAGNQKDKLKQIGNAVPCNLARELCKAAIVA